MSGLLMLSGAWVPLFLGISSLGMGPFVVVGLVEITAGVLTAIGAIQTMTRRPAVNQGRVA
jgi:hypothetical protein